MDSNRLSLLNILEQAFRYNGLPGQVDWPQHGLPVERRNLTLQMNPDTPSFDGLLQAPAGRQDPDVLFARAVSAIASIQVKICVAVQDVGQDGQRTLGPGDRTVRTLVDGVCSALADFIFSSNAHDQAGLPLFETQCICHRIFAGMAVYEGMDPQSCEYQDVVAFLRTERCLQDPSTGDVTRARREVIQHALALRHVLEAVLLRNCALTEDLILEMHAILCAGVPSPNGRTEHAGRYRDVEVHANTATVSPWVDVPGRMGRFIQDLNDRVRASEEGGTIDPFHLAADLCQDFVNIHPFEEGSGRMGRLLLTAYLLKYGVSVIDMGLDAHGREVYKTLVEKGGHPDTEQEARHELAGYILQLGTAFLSRVESSLSELPTAATQMKGR